MIPTSRIRSSFRIGFVRLVETLSAMLRPKGSTRNRKLPASDPKPEIPPERRANRDAPIGVFEVDRRQQKPPMVKSFSRPGRWSTEGWGIV